MGAGSLPVAAVLAACAGDERGGQSTSATTATTGSPATTRPASTVPRTSVPPTTVPPTTVPMTTAPFDPATPWWLQGNYAPVLQEVDAFDLTVIGALPPELDGVYVKNGSNPPRRDSPHWFFGDGMVHGLQFGGGAAQWYRNRYVHTVPYLDNLGFGQGTPSGANNQSNVSVFWHGGRLLSSGEVGFPFELQPADLGTVGAHDFAGALAGSFTAHPKIDPVTGRLHAFGYGFTPPFLEYYIVEPDGTMSHREPIDLPRSTMIHDFQITETDVVFWDMPLVFDLQLAIDYINDPSSGIMPYQWQPQFGSRIGIMPLAGSAAQIRWFDIDPCYVFHSVNAFRRGQQVVVDVCRLSSMFDPSTAGGLGGELSLRRWTIDTVAGTVSDDVLETVDPGDLPGRDPRRVGREYRYGFLTGNRDNAHTVELGGLIKHDFVDGTREVWDPGPTRHATEPLFVPTDPTDLADDAGWLLSFVHDDATDQSVFAVLDATDVAAGPVAEVVLPQRVPYGFHGTWVPSDS